MKRTSTFFFLGALIAISSLFFNIIYPFIFSIGGAFLLAHIFLPLYSLLNKKLSNPQFASCVTTLIILTLVVLPFIGLIFIVSTEMHEAYLYVKKFLQESQKDSQNLFFTIVKENTIYHFLQEQKWFLQLLKLIKNEALLTKIYQFFSHIADYFFGLLTSFIVNIPKFFISLLILIYLLYYVFIEKEKIISTVKSFMPFKKEETEQTLKEISKVINATIYSTIIMGLSEGFYGAAVLYCFSVSSTALWGVVMTILTMIPLIGANIILLSIAFYKLLLGDYFAGIGILVIGCGGILVAENIIKPQIVGNRAGLHSSLVVLSSLGAISIMGISGFIVGPIIASLFVVVWKQFRQRMLKNENFDSSS